MSSRITCTSVTDYSTISYHPHRPLDQPANSRPDRPKPTRRASEAPRLKQLSAVIRMCNDIGACRCSLVLYMQCEWMIWRAWRKDCTERMQLSWNGRWWWRCHQRINISRKKRNISKYVNVFINTTCSWHSLRKRINTFSQFIMKTTKKYLNLNKILPPRQFEFWLITYTIFNQSYSPKVFQILQCDVFTFSQPVIIQCVSPKVDLNEIYHFPVSQKEKTKHRSINQRVLKWKRNRFQSNSRSQPTTHISPFHLL